MKKIFLPFFFLIFVLVFIFFLIPRIFVVKEVTCKTQYGSCNPSVLEDVSKVLGQKLINSKGLITKALGNNPYVEKFFMTFKFPNRLDLFVIERKAKFAMVSASEDNLFLISQDGLILSSDKDARGYPLLISDDPITLIGEKVDSKTLFALEISLRLSKVVGVNKFTKQENILIVELKDGPRVLFPLEGDKTLLLGSFVLIYNELKKQSEDSKIKINSVSEIDLRYKNPVLRLKNFS